MSEIGENEQVVRKCAATVGDLIRHLQENFKPTDALCFWDEGGAHMECVHVPDSWFKEGQMFKYVSDEKKRRIEKWGDSKDEVDKNFPFVSDGDVLIW